MKMRRRFAIRMETSARRFSLFAFWLRQGCRPVEAWDKSGRTI